MQDVALCPVCGHALSVVFQSLEAGDDPSVGFVDRFELQCGECHHSAEVLLESKWGEREWRSRFVHAGPRRETVVGATKDPCPRCGEPVVPALDEDTLPAKLVELLEQSPHERAGFRVTANVELRCVACDHRQWNTRVSP